MRLAFTDRLQLKFPASRIRCGDEHGLKEWLKSVGRQEVVQYKGGQSIQKLVVRRNWLFAGDIIVRQSQDDPHTYRLTFELILNPTRFFVHNNASLEEMEGTTPADLLCPDPNLADQACNGSLEGNDSVRAREAPAFGLAAETPSPPLARLGLSLLCSRRERASPAAPRVANIRRPGHSPAWPRDQRERFYATSCFVVAITSAMSALPPIADIDG